LKRAYACADALEFVHERLLALRVLAPLLLLDALGRERGEGLGVDASVLAPLGLRDLDLGHATTAVVGSDVKRDRVHSLILK
jgi:hypothetical protein